MPMHSDDRAELALILQIVARSSGSPEERTLVLERQLKLHGWTLTPPKPFNDWGRVG